MHQWKSISTNTIANVLLYSIFCVRLYSFHGFIFTNTFHNIYFASNIFFTSIEKNIHTAFKKNRRTLSKRMAKRTCFCSISFSVQFYSCSLMLLFSLPFPIVSLCVSMCIWEFFGCCRVVELYVSSFVAWPIV